MTASSLQSELGRSQLFRIQRLGLCFVAFVLPALNGRPYVLSSGLYCVPIALGLLVHRLLHNDRRMFRWSENGFSPYVLFAWVIVATISTLANPGNEAVSNLLWSYWAPFVLFISLLGLRLSREDYRYVLFSLAFGLGLRFCYGAWVFYSTWGIPDFSELAMARYDLVHMEPYMSATFGSTGATASVLAVSIPVLITSLLIRRGRSELLVLVPVIAACTANAFITGSRATIIVVAAIMGIVVMKFKSRSRFVILALLVVSVFLFVRNIGDDNLARFRSAVEMDAQDDQSVSERLESIGYGVEQMQGHVFGIGPGMSFIDNPYFVPHQFAVAQGADLGVLGMLSVVGLTIIVIGGVVRLDLRRGHEQTQAIAFRFGALTWIVYAMTANIGLSSGATIPWSGLLIVFLALGSSREPTSSRKRTRST